MFWRDIQIFQHTVERVIELDIAMAMAMAMAMDRVIVVYENLLLQIRRITYSNVDQVILRLRSFNLKETTNHLKHFP